MNIVQIAAGKPKPFANKEKYGNGNIQRTSCMNSVVDYGLHWWLDSRGAIVNILPTSFGNTAGLESLWGSRFWELGSELSDQSKLKASIGEALLARENATFPCSMNVLVPNKEVRVSIFVNESTTTTQVAVIIFTQPLLSGHQQLSAQENKSLALLAKGCLPAEIANQMACSRSTVQTYLLRARKKLNISNFVALTVYAARTY